MDALKIGDLIVDEETGEVLELPEGIGEPISWFTQRALEAKSAHEEWEKVYNAYRRVLGRLLDEAGAKRMQTEYGSPYWKSRVDRKSVIERLPSVIEKYELDGRQVDMIFTCASALNAGRLESLKMTGEIPHEAIDELIEVKSTSWVQVDRPRPFAPKMEKVSVS